MAVIVGTLPCIQDGIYVPPGKPFQTHISSEEEKNCYEALGFEVSLEDSDLKDNASSGVETPEAIKTYAGRGYSLAIRFPKSASVVKIKSSTGYEGSEAESANIANDKGLYLTTQDVDSLILSVDGVEYELVL